MTYAQLANIIHKMSPKQQDQTAVIIHDEGYGYVYESLVAIQDNDNLCEILAEDIIVLISANDTTSKL